MRTRIPTFEAEALDVAFSPAWNATRVTAFLDDAIRLAANLRPLWHPLGFIHTELIKTSNSTYRLHIWPLQNRKPKTPNWPIHTHTYYLESRVLAGVVTNRLFDIDCQQEAADTRIYEVRYNSDGSAICPTTRCGKLMKIDETCFKAGNSYSVRLGVFHESYVPDSMFAATIVRTSQHVNTAPLVAGSLKTDVREYGYVRAMVDHDAFTHLLSAIAQGADTGVEFDRV